MLAQPKYLDVYSNQFRDVVSLSQTSHAAPTVLLYGEWHKSITQTAYRVCSPPTCV